MNLRPLRSAAVAILAAATPLFISATALASGGCGQECNKCHSLSVEEAGDLLKGVIPDARLTGVRMAPASGLWEVTLKSREGQGIVYIDFARQNVIVGQIFSIKSKRNLTQERFVQISKVDFSAIPLHNAIVMGNPDAPHRIVVFDDPD